MIFKKNRNETTILQRMFVRFVESNFFKFFLSKDVTPTGSTLGAPLLKTFSLGGRSGLGDKTDREKQCRRLSVPRIISNNLIFLFPQQ